MIDWSIAREFLPLDAARADLGLWGVENGDRETGRQWLRPDQMIPILWEAVRSLRGKVVSLEARFTRLSGMPQGADPDADGSSAEPDRFADDRRR